MRGRQIRVERCNRKDLYQRALAAQRVDDLYGVKAGLRLVREGLSLPWKVGVAAKARRIAHRCQAK